jgi:hypothetical protein
MGSTSLGNWYLVLMIGKWFQFQWNDNKEKKAGGGLGVAPLFLFHSAVS